MATINFPDTTGQPTDGSFTYEFEGITYIWDGEKWISESATGGGSTPGFSGNYNDLTNKPDIPDATSDLTNDSGFIDDPGVTKIIAGDNISIDNDGTGEVRISSTGSSGGGGGTVTVDLAWNADGNNDAQILSSAGNPATVPIVTNSVAGLMTGDQKQKLEQIDGAYISTIDLTYQKGGNKDSAGKVKAGAGGSDATIPIASNTQAGLISGTMHGKLSGLDLSQYLVDGDNVSRLTNDVDYLRDGGRDNVGELVNNVGYLRNGNRDNVSSLVNDASYITLSDVPAPIPVTAQHPLTVSNNDVQLNYAKGLHLVSNQLELDLGSGLVYDGNKIKADIPEQAVDSFEPIVVINAQGEALNCKRNAQEGTTVSGTFVVPDGATRLAMIARAKISLKSRITKLVTDGENVPCAWCKGIGYKISFGNGVSNPNTGSNEDLMKVDGLILPLIDERMQGCFTIRMNDLLVPGSGNRTITYSYTPVVDDSTGDTSGTLAQMLFGAFNMLLLPTD